MLTPSNVPRTKREAVLIAPYGCVPKSALLSKA